MPDAPIVGLEQARCVNEKCKLLLARVRLTMDSVAEIKCRRCGKVNVFQVERDGDDVAIHLIPDGQGGYIPPDN